MISISRQPVDSAVDSGPFFGGFGDFLSTFEIGRQVDYFLSQLFSYLYTTDNKGKVERKWGGVEGEALYYLLPRKFREDVYLSTGPWLEVTS